MSISARRRKSLAALGIAALVALGCSFLLTYSVRTDTGLLARVEGATLDMRFRMRGPVEPDPQIMIVAIDQRSLDQVGRWPWSRTDLAALIEAIDSGRGAKPRAIVLDIAFPQVEQAHYELVEQRAESQGLPIILLDQAERGDPNQVLAEAVERSGRVVLAAFFLTSTPGGQHPATDELAGSFAIPVIVGELGEDAQGFVRNAKGAEPNIGLLDRAAAGTGFFNVFPDPDGIMRHKDQVIAFGEDLYPSLEITALRVAEGLARDELGCRIASYGVSNLWMGARRIDTDERGRIMLNYRGPVGTFETVSAADVLDGRVDPVLFANRIVFLGVTALGNFDVAITPFDSQGFPGVEVHATALDNIKNDRSLVRPAWYVLFDLALVWALALIGGQAFATLRPWIAGITAVTMLVFTWWLASWMFNSLNYVVGVTLPVLALVLTLIMVTLYRLLVEVRVQSKMKHALAPYVPDPVAQRIAADPDRANLAGAKREITVLFVDIRSFTRLTAQVTPEQMVGFLSEFTHEVSEAVFEHGGLLDKFIGDAAMAFWGAPLHDEAQVDHALACAVDIQLRIETLAARHRGDEFNDARVGIGIATGEAVVGALGSLRRLDYTAVGEVVNLAQRLEKMNKSLETSVLVAGSSVRHAEDKWPLKSRGEHLLIEGTEPIEVFELCIK